MSVVTSLLLNSMFWYVCIAVLCQKKKTYCLSKTTTFLTKTLIYFFQTFPSSATTLHFEFYHENVDEKNSRKVKTTASYPIDYLSETLIVLCLGYILFIYDILMIVLVILFII